MASIVKTPQQQFEEYDRVPGDRARLFAAIAEGRGIVRVLYPGSYIDVSSSFIFPAVTYVDSDRKAKMFFADREGVGQLIAAKKHLAIDPAFTFLAADYTTDLPVSLDHFDLLVSLYAGFISEPCARYLKPGGWLLANDSHGDASLASRNPEFRLVAVVERLASCYVVSSDHLEGYFVPRRGEAPTVELLRDTRRGPVYTKSPAAYLFQRQSL